jgi:transposase
MVRKTRRHFSLEFKREAVRMFHSSGKPITAAARDLGIHVNVLSAWVAQLGRKPASEETPSSSEGALTSAEKEELKQLRKDKARLEMEVEILGKATAFFANRNR